MAHAKKVNLAGKTGRKRSRGRGKGWVRKNVIMNQRKLDAALDLVAFRRERVRGIAAVRGADGIEDVLEKRLP